MIPHAAYTRRDLDLMTCDEPGCDHTSHEVGLCFHGSCHPSSPTQTSYQDGVLTITCALCRQFVARIRVAR